VSEAAAERLGSSVSSPGRRLVLGGNGAPGLVAAVGLLAALSLFFWASGALFPQALPSDVAPRRLTGMALMLILMPAYLLAAWSFGQRRSLQLVERLRAILPESEDADRAQAAIRRSFATTWRWGALAGVGLGLLNTQPLEAFGKSEVPLIDGSLSIGQLVMWGSIGLVLGVNYRKASVFRKLGGVLRFDLFRQEQLRPLAQAGIVDVAMVAGAILFTPLQALDAEFRWFNYHFVVIVALPVSAFLLFWPLVPVHRRLRTDREARIAAVETQLEEQADLAQGAEAVCDLELLLAHRERLHDAHTWPLGMRQWSRVLFYLVIPPLAWAGAALVERAVETFLPGSGP
jgi:hypothetical protein